MVQSHDNFFAEKTQNSHSKSLNSSEEGKKTPWAKMFDSVVEKNLMEKFPIESEYRTN